MGSRRVLPFFLMSLLLTSSLARAQSSTSDTPAAKPVEKDMGIGDTSIGDKSDIGSPDSIDNFSVPNSSNPPPANEVKTMPDFNEVPPPGASETAPAPEITDRTSDPVVTPPAAEAPAAPAPAPVAETQSDGPDFRRERNFNSVYKKYNLDPTPLESWEKITGDRASQIYKVQKGDTLWDLSKTLFGEPNYWPKVWALNKDEVYNPHEIDTWMQIRFYPGNLNEPPTLSVSDAPKPVAGAEPPEEALPAPKKRSPPLKGIPPSIPVYRRGRIPAPIDYSSIRPRAPIPRADAALGYFISDTALAGQGKIQETELGGMTAVEYQYVFVTTPSTGEKFYTVVREVGTVKDAQGHIGHLIEVQGEIEMIEPASDRTDLYRAMVRRNLTSIEVGSLLIPGRIETVSTNDGPPSPGPTLQVVGAEYHPNRKMVDAEGFIFLSGGASAGLQVGQILEIRPDLRIRNLGSGVRTTSQVIGHARVVKTSERFATAFLTRMSDAIHIGDYVGSGTAAPEISVAPTSAAATTSSDEDLEKDFEGTSATAPADSPSSSAPEKPEDDDLKLD